LLQLRHVLEILVSCGEQTEKFVSHQPQVPHALQQMECAEMEQKDLSHDHVSRSCVCASFSELGSLSFDIQHPHFVRAMRSSAPRNMRRLHAEKTNIENIKYPRGRVQLKKLRPAHGN
jgi:hypothetical protein